MFRMIVCVLCGLVAPTHAGAAVDGPAPILVRVGIDERGAVDLAELLSRLAERTGVDVPRREAFRLPVRGLAGGLTLRLLVETLGEGVVFEIEADGLRVTIDRDTSEPARRAEWIRRLEELAARVERDARLRRVQYGLRALGSYVPGEMGHPTVCLIHGMNSTSRSFVHMVPELERAGFGVVVYDFPDNQDLDITVAEFGAQWRGFRAERGETLPWAIVTHSMGGLVARDYVEGGSYAGDVSALILIAPPNGGSALAKAQGLLQWVEGVQGLDRRATGVLDELSEGLGEAAEDLLPESRFLARLNARPRREGVRYCILAGDAGFLTRESRMRLESRLGSAARLTGVFGRVARMAVSDLPVLFDELSEGTGDGAVSVSSTRLEGVSEHRVIHANHVELIRGPLLYPEPGPVACMPQVLEWLEAMRSER
jgi:pimeloyl-ACP methyl ester carboxylesterase